ncbi:LANO_0B07778g1_1 [Lachancea nothofagi CBS 11611]|uniref:LANO_0B07778g1_1 n=1 Tax=Lachancea nothofagi CBS 11611 TaxID=1266666 RepID=A0A1G4J019_9SACH|nr:LANO_0B07778g1_1 [Lachancea nothofagi CBS 11611]
MDTQLVENELSFATARRVSLEVSNLSVLASKDVPIVRDISMKINSGSIMAIIGGSGSGKTTLLNVLASKMSKSLRQTGSFSFIPESVDKEHIRDDITTAYLTQQDILSARLTCRETLQYASALKLRESKAERRKLVEELIAELGLRDCADTLVGDSRHPGLSGGEKRRLSIGVQMISNPSLLFLDEPTTGLDAYSAYLVVKTLRKLSHKGGRTFIMSIHQPRSDIIFLLDQVCILSRGFNVYCDDVNNMVPYFRELGFEAPPHANPADYFIDICSVDSRSPQLMQQTQNRLDELIKNWKAHQRLPEACPALQNAKVKPTMPSVSFLNQVRVLTERSIKLNMRDPTTMVALLFEPVVIGVITGWIFFKPDATSLKGVRTITSALYSAAALQGYLFLLFEIYRLCEQDIKIYDRERAEGCVTPWSFIMARRLANFVFEDLAIPFLFSIVTFFMYGLSVNAKSFFVYFSVVLLVHQCSASFALLSVAISRDFSQASLVGNLNYTLQSMACGFFVNAKTMPVYVRWTKYITYLWYSFGALISNQFTDFACEAEGQQSCAGNMVLETLGYPRFWRTTPVIIVFCWSVAFYICAITILYWKTVDVSLAKRVKTKKNAQGGIKKVETGTETNRLETDMEANTLEAAAACREAITIKIRGVSLKVHKRRLPSIKSKRGGSRDCISILNDINAVFKPNAINAIMGPSGSGKSTLLNLLSGKLKSTFLEFFETEGNIHFNDNQVSQHVFKNMCSFVPQDDDHLLAQLTVKETLSFAAELRLHHISPAARNLRVDELISELGLNHCEDTLVGNELIKGISGGEKRRVSMGIHLLTDPPILLLDEPTSGLDSFTSFKVLEVLANISQKPGKTVILTIHQPRAEMFKQLGNILLLAKGGRVAYNGCPFDMVAYFGHLGFECPPFTNVADYFLDIISVNTQNDINEAKSRERVSSLLSSWDQQMKEVSEFSIDSNDSLKYNGFIHQEHTRHKASFRVAYQVCVRRQFKTITRNMESLGARLAQIPGVGIILALFFAPVKHNYASVSNRLGLVQQSTALYFTGMLTNLACYPGERNYFYQEFDDGVYGVTPFFLGYMTIELPMAALASSLYAVFTVLVCGLNRSASNFFVTMYCSVIISTCGEALGIITNTLFTTPGFVVNVVSILLTIGCVMSGLLSLQMSRVLRGFNYMSPVNYTAMIMINYAFPGDLRLTCSDGGRNADGSCLFSTGTQVLESYGLEHNTSTYLGITICVWFVYRLIAYLTLRAKLEWIKW